ncbi:MAG: beta-ketoacyl synthase [Thiomonas sp. 13-66-29]|jgi:3-oxoacyl-[acyl-carrier-protein] synthase II|nr:MAG: beta-ketoacyl synthase [Thiomonas sp. 13-66-29]
MNQVFMTGIGMLSPLGKDRQASFAAALSAHSAIRRAPEALSAGLPNVLMAPAAVEPESLLDSQDAGLDRATQFSLVAAQEAMADAGIDETPSDADRFGVFVGIGFGGAHTLDAMFARYYTALFGGEHSRKRATVVHPLSVPRMMANASMAAVSMRYGLRGMGNTYSVACASSAIAAGEALRAIRHGYLDAALVIGTEAMLTPGSMVAWNALRVMARPNADDPAASCRPFDRDRSGFVLGEGAAALVLESRSRAERRGAVAHAELAGYGCTSDAHHLTAPSVEGQVAAMRQALDEARLAPDQIQYLNAHGTATDAGDVIETQSIVGVFGAASRQLAVSSTKAVHGHLIGAGGTLELALAVMAMESGSIPPTAHLEHPDPRCTLDYVPLQARHGCRIDAVMSNSFAFGGSNASLIARRMTG